MMKVENNTHLGEDQILWAVIDEQELGTDTRQHLLGCTVCKKKVAHLQDELADFGQKASLYVPPFSGQLKMVEAKPAPVRHNLGWLPFFGAAATAVFVLFFYFMDMQTMAPNQITTTQSGESLLEEEILMREISEMVEYPLSEEMYEISGDYENGFDDDFLQFVVPEVQEDFQSELILQGGIKRC